MIVDIYDPFFSDAFPSPAVRFPPTVCGGDVCQGAGRGYSMYLIYKGGVGVIIMVLPPFALPFRFLIWLKG